MQEIVYSNEYEILTPHGFQPFKGVLKKQSDMIYTIWLNNGIELSCTSDHKIFTNSGLKQVNKIQECDLIETQSGYESIAKIMSIPFMDECVYDALEVANGNLYYTNSIVSHNCRFLGSSNTLISGDALEKLSFNEPIKSDKFYNIYKLPEKNHIYVACVDVSEGIGRDYSTIVIMDITSSPYEQVYVYKNNEISPWDFSSVINIIINKYNEAYLIVENNSIGKIVADDMFHTFEYENLINSKIKNTDEKISSYGSIGVRMTKRTKSIGCSALKSLIEDNLLLIHDWNTIQELCSFVKVNTGYEAEKGKNDDIVTPLVQFGWLTTQPYFEELTKAGLRNLLEERREEESEMTHTIFGFYDDGIDLEQF